MQDPESALNYWVKKQEQGQRGHSLRQSAHHRSQSGSEVPQERRLMDQFVAGNTVAAAPHVQDDLDHVFDVALRVNAAGNG